MRKIAMLCTAAALAAATVTAVSAQTTTRSPSATGSLSGSGSASGSVTTNAAPGRLGADTDDSTAVKGAGAAETRTPLPSQPGASADAPGQRATSSAPAESLAPGQVKKRKGAASAEDFAPGHEAQAPSSTDVNGGAATSR